MRPCVRPIARLTPFLAKALRAVPRAAILCLILLGCAAGPGAAPPTQSAAPTTPSNTCAQAVSPPADVAKQPSYRQVLVSVQNQNNLAPPKLTAKDLRLHQGEKELQIAFFQPQPVAVAILVDTSGSMEFKLPMCRSGLEVFINDLNPSDEISLFAFSDHPFLLVRPTTEHSRVTQRLAVLHAFGRTALYNSLIAGMEVMSQSCVRNKALLLITDGIDDASSATLDQTVAMARKMSMPIYSIGIGNPTAKVTSFLGSPYGDINALDTKALAALATDTGGETFTVTLDDKGEALKQATTAIAGEVSNRYIVGFIGDGSTRELQVDAPKDKGLILKVTAPD
jgi:VWFA-related protein